MSSTDSPNQSLFLSIEFVLYMSSLILQLGLFLKKILKGDIGSISKSDFIEAISRYLDQRAGLVSSDFSKFCLCGGKIERVQHTVSRCPEHEQQINLQERQLQVRI